MTTINSWTVLAALISMGCTSILEGNSTSKTDGAPGDGDSGDNVGEGDGDGDSADPTVCLPGVPGTSQIPRLSRAEYDATIRDLLGLETQPSTMLAPDSEGSVDVRAWEGYQQAAAALSTQVLTDATARAKVIPCTPSGDGGDCAQMLVTTLGPRAFRRPLTTEESARFAKLIANRAAITHTNSFEDLAQLLIEAFLVSPSFLLRSEIAEQPEGDYFSLTQYEVASRLSYLVWGSMPDDTLFAAASENSLATKEQILVQAQRMLSDPRGREMVKAFHQHYLHMGDGGRWANIQRDPALFPEYSDEMSDLLSEETERFVDYIVFDQAGTFQSLVTTPVGFVNAALAPLYDLNPADYPSPDLVATPLDASQRSGLFTRLGFLASHAYYDRSSPIHRGAFLQKHVLCAPIGTPPPGAEGEPLPTEGLQTNRERVDAQTASAACQSCHHTHINPTGFALEAYNAVGAYQVAEAFSGATLDTTATVRVGEADVPVDGPVALSEALANSSEAQACYARHWVQFAYHRDVNNEDSCTVNEIAAKLTTGGYTILDLILDLTQSDSFRLRAIGTEVSQ